MSFKINIINLWVNFYIRWILQLIIKKRLRVAVILEVNTYRGWKITTIGHTKSRAPISYCGRQKFSRWRSVSGWLIMVLKKKKKTLRLRCMVFKQIVILELWCFYSYVTTIFCLYFYIENNIGVSCYIVQVTREFMYNLSSTYSKLSYPRIIKYTN